MLDPHNIILVVARSSPALTSIFSIILFFLTDEIEYVVLGISLFFADGLNHILKDYVFKPIMGDKNWPIIGLGKRPKGANNTGLIYFDEKNLSTSYGMPSGHSQNIAMFSTYMILKLLNSTMSNNIKMIGYIFFIGLTIYIMWSRVYMICHTVQQTIVGSSIGILLGYSLFNVIRKEPSYFS